MDTTTLFLILLALFVVLIVLVAVYVGAQGSKKPVTTTAQTAVTFEMMCSIINRSSANNIELNNTVDTIIARYSEITDIDVYGSLLEKLCTHPNTDSKVILRFQKALIKANPKYKEQLEKSLKIGLAGRK